MTRISKLTHAEELSAIREKECDISVEIEKVIESDFAKYISENALSHDDIGRNEMQNCFENFDKVEICDFLECEETVYNNYYSRYLKSA